MSKSATVYPDSFFAIHEQGSERSATRVVPELLAIVSPHSVIDVGCGIGAWLAEFEKRGITDALGVDGDYVATERLRISPEKFLAKDLTKPLGIHRRFDLAISLEVAEHLPENRSESFVSDLVGLAPVVLFSAAIPFQGGTFHVNEQWPDYWEKIFRQHNYLALDCLRRVLWDDESVDWWYRQNAILYASAELVQQDPILSRIAAQQPKHILRMVHPRLYEEKYRAALNPTLRTIVRGFSPALVRTTKRILKLR
jgi:SAM-dependent methyltransferase